MIKHGFEAKKPSNVGYLLSKSIFRDCLSYENKASFTK